MTPEEFAHERAVRQIMEARIAAWLARKGSPGSRRQRVQPFQDPHQRPEHQPDQHGHHRTQPALHTGRSV